MLAFLIALLLMLLIFAVAFGIVFLLSVDHWLITLLVFASIFFIGAAVLYSMLKGMIV